MGTVRDAAENPLDLNIGQKFYYWDHFKHKSQFVVPKHANIKEEILHNKTHSLTMNKFEIIMGRTRKFMKCNKVRAMKAEFTSDRHYGIALGANITESHILAVVLYAGYEFLSQEL